MNIYLRNLIIGSLVFIVILGVQVLVIMFLATMFKISTALGFVVVGLIAFAIFTWMVRGIRKTFE